MTLSKMYRERAAALAEQARSTLEPIPKERLKKIALAYERLAEEYAKRARLHENKAPGRRDGRSHGFKSKILKRQRQFGR
jgi:uncharacterized protein (UPF0335 family)